MKTSNALALLLLGGLASEARAQNCPTRPYWPTTEWRSHADEVKVTRAAEIKALEEFIFPGNCIEAGRKGICTEGMLIIKAGEIVYQRYGRGFDASKRHAVSWITFGAINALTGVAVAHGAVTLADSVCDHLTGIRPDNCAIRAQDLLEWSSGLDWCQYVTSGLEAGVGGTQQLSDLAMQIGEGRADQGRFALNHPRRDEPGTTWLISGGDVTALSAVISTAMTSQYGEHWAWDLLFDRIGAGNSVFERDRQGTLTVWWASLHDVARLGYLYLNDGCWDGERILPENWVAEAGTVPVGFKTRRILQGAGNDVAGRLWFPNVAVPEQNLGKMLPSMPDDLLLVGVQSGPMLFVIPSLDLVIVRLGDEREAQIQLDRLLDLAVPIAR